MPYFQPVTIGQETFDLAHLEPFSFEVESVQAKKRLRVHVTFTNHCFTTSYDPQHHPIGEPIIDADKPRPRTFCQTRYRLSLALPAIISKLAATPRDKVHETASERNWCYSVKIDDPAGPYHVFFEIRRAARDRRQWQDLQMVVESAYHQDQSPPKLKGTMAFMLLCGKIYCGERTATKR